MFRIGALNLPNRIAMATATRAMAADDMPGELHTNLACGGAGEFPVVVSQEVSESALLARIEAEEI